VRFIVTTEGENLTALAQRLFRAEGKEELAAARRRLLELNPDLPDPKNILAGTVVVVPADLGGERPPQGSSFADVTKGVLKQVSAVVGQLEETLSAQVREESAFHAHEKKLLAEPRLRRAARESAELTARLEQVAKANAKRQQGTKELQRLAKTATREMAEDLAVLTELAGKLLPD
jgi:hypothetical protein